MRACSHAHYSRKCDRTPQFTSAHGGSSSDNQFTWAVKNFTKNLPMLSEPSYSIQDRTNFSKLDYFAQYFDDELIDMIVDKTNQTAVYKTGKSLLITNGSEKSSGDAKYIKFKPSPNFKHMKKYLKSKFEEDKIASASNGTAESSSNKTTENGNKANIQPPLPPYSPPPDSPTNFTFKTEVEDDSYELNSEEKTENGHMKEYSMELKPNKRKKIMCKDFVRGCCKRGEACIYAHELDLDQLNGVYKFCRDFANGKCKRLLCVFVHATTFEKENFFRTGILPPHTLSHLKDINIVRPQCIPGGPPRETVQPVYANSPPDLHTSGAIPPVPLLNIPQSSVNGKHPQDEYQSSSTPSSSISELSRECSESVPSTVVFDNEPTPEECLGCEVYKIRYQQQLAKRDALLKSTKALDENIAKLSKKKNWLTAVLKVMLSGPDTYSNSDTSA
ncbi:uncharacterized protein LOC128199963 isoform X3 [Galleria mellonella]|nr:uncharacterized protein LOC128199963 isoform X3 [Galleria mellonella]